MDILAIVNACLCAGLCLLLGWLVMAPTVRDGVVIKLGLILASIGLLACALVLLQHDGTDWRPLLTAWLIIHVGVLITVAGLVLLVMRDTTARTVMHVATGWPPLGGSASEGGGP